MTKNYKLHLQVRNGHLRLIPQGVLTTPAVEQLLGVARSALTFFPMLLVDLRGTREAQDDDLTLLEEGLQQLISEKKLALTCEMPQMRWVVHQPSTPRIACTCGGLCRDCPHRSSDPSQTHRNDAKSSGRNRG
jgi:hypothetical protein